MTTLPPGYKKTYYGMTWKDWKEKYDLLLAWRINHLNEDYYDIDKVEAYNPRPIFNDRRSPEYAARSAIDNGVLEW
jgi:hypothetical protein